MQDEKYGVADQIAPAQHAIRRQARRKEKCKQACNPNGRSEGIDQQCLLKEVLSKRKHNVTAFGSDAVHQLDERPSVVNVPKQVRQKNEECSRSAQPDPLVQEGAALLSKQQTDHKDDASAGMKRMLRRESPSTARQTWIRNGMSGGWSTYPQPR